MYRTLILWIRNALGVSRTEANGYLVFSVFMLVAHFWVSRDPAPHDFNFEDPGFQDSISQLLLKFEGNTTVIDEVPKFNPNSVSLDSLLKWGIDYRLASNLIKYRKAGGRFNRLADVKKLFGMTDSLFLILNASIQIPFDTIPIQNSTKKVYSKKSVVQTQNLIDLNEVDSVWLKKIYGIGPVLSKRIVKYRKILGGFHSMEQLQEVYGLTEEVIDRLKNKLLVKPNPTLIRIDLNNADARLISLHPYFSFDQARAIIAYRDQHGWFNDLSQIKNIHLIDDSTYLRVYPYLDF